jgi:GntR family transcriptional repressor for pyruvate dehydrogenase complex
MSKGSVQTAPGENSADTGLVLVPGRRQLLSDQLYGQILDQIVSGRLNEGDRLPPEKEICEMFGVSRPVVRDALLQLRADGLVQSRQGSGTYVQRRPANRLKEFGNTADLARYMRCLEVRRPLEAAAARFAAERRTSSQLLKIEEIHSHLEKDAEAGYITPANDSAFHMAIANATGNEYFSDVLRPIQDSISSFMEVTSNLTRTGSHERILQVLSEHTNVLEAIRSQEPEAAKIAMLFHFERIRRRITDRTQDK